MKLKIILLVIPLVLICACSSSDDTVKNEQTKEPEVYVFDDVSKVDTSKAEPSKTVETIPEVKEQMPAKVIQPSIIKKFIVQVGAFTSKDRADSFVRENQPKIEQKMSIAFSNQVQLYVVQLPPFISREEAEKVRNSLWQITPFKGAFIITTDGQK
jgi:cell division septation protein DedD